MVTGRAPHQGTAREYGRGPDKAWVFAALRVKDGKSLTFTSRSRNSEGYIRLLKKIERAVPEGIIYLIADNLRTHKSIMVGDWLADHPRIEHAFIPKGAAWLNLIEVWSRLFRRQALAGQDFANSHEIDQATRVATRQLNRKASPWVWGRPPKPSRHRRRTFVLVFLSKIGHVKVAIHRPLEGTVKTATVRKTPTGKWFVCFTCEVVGFPR